MTDDASLAALPVGDDIAIYREDDGVGFGRIREPEVRRIAEYWAGLRNGRAMPRMKDIDPLDIPWALGGFYMGDYDAETGRFAYRIAGDNITQMFERQTKRPTMKGADFSAMFPKPSAEMVRRRWRPLGERGAIVLMTGLIYLAAERLPVGERIILPLSEDGERVTGFMGYTKVRFETPEESSDSPGLDIWYIPHQSIA
ncbi:MAG: PAS domain-containing protein [Alphaproteobacteria bacterium]|nr:PAS domain-containing protein [Alphaproteobacteria bacterium]